MKTIWCMRSKLAKERRTMLSKSRPGFTEANYQLGVELWSLAKVKVNKMVLVFLLRPLNLKNLKIKKIKKLFCIFYMNWFFTVPSIPTEAMVVCVLLTLPFHRRPTREKM